MAWKISTPTYETISVAHSWIILIVQLGIPLVCLLLLLCSPICCILKCTRNVKFCRMIDEILLGIANHLFWFLDRETRNDKTHLIVAGMLAPVGYTYFLLYTVALLMVHYAFAFFDSTVSVSYTTIYLDVETAIDCSLNNSEPCTITQYEYQLELHLINGLEAGAATFSISVLTFAIITLLLLNGSGGRPELPEHRQSYKCFGKRYKYNYKSQCIVIIQIVFTVLPRILFYILYVYMVTSPRSVDRVKKDGALIQLPTGLFDGKSFYIMGAICDSISTAMLTPWYYFDKREPKRRRKKLSLQ